MAGTDPFSAGAGALLGGLGGLFGSNDANNNFESALKHYQHAATLISPYFNQSLQQYRQALDAIQSGYGDASNYLQRGSDLARQDAIAQGQQAQGGLTQNMASNGLYRTSAYGQGLRGIGFDTGRALGGIDSNLAQAQAGLAQQRGQAIAGARYNIGNLYPSWLQNKVGIETGMGNLYLNAPMGGTASFLQGAVGGAAAGASFK